MSKQTTGRIVARISVGEDGARQVERTPPSMMDDPVYWSPERREWESLGEKIYRYVVRGGRRTW